MKKNPCSLLCIQADIHGKQLICEEYDYLQINLWPVINPHIEMPVNLFLLGIILVQLLEKKEVRFLKSLDSFDYKISYSVRNP